MNKTSINIPQENRSQIAALLNQDLAALTDLLSQARYAHWNVRGTQFFNLHKLFEELYLSLEGVVDDLAERITTLGGIAEGTVRQAAAESPLTEFNGTQKGDLDYLNELQSKFSQFASLVRAHIDQTDELGDADTADLLTGLSRTVDKDLWLLEAHHRA